MSKTEELRRVLKGLFKSIFTEVHYETVPDTVPYPYLQFELNEILSENGKTVLDLEVNIFDYGNSTSLVETKADNLQALLHKYYFINDKIQFSCYKSNRNIIQEEDKKIRRRRLTFEIQLHELREE